jgi:stress response protein YsnF
MYGSFNDADRSLEYSYSVELHNELLNIYLENMLKEEVVVQFEVIFQNFQGRAEKIQKNSQINALDSRFDVGNLGIRIRTAFEPSGYIFTGG